MKNNDYLLPGIAAISIAILFPLTWIFELISISSTTFDYRFVFDLGVTSFLFLLVGLINVYIYFYLMKLLHDHHNYKRADFALIAMIVLTVIFYLGDFVLDVFSLWSNEMISIKAASWLFGAFIIAFGIIDLLIAVILLVGHKELPKQFIFFAALSLIMGVFELTLVMSPAVLLLFPIMAILMSLIFLRKPEMIEIV